MKNSFNVNDTAEFISRIDKLTPTTKPIWGKMDVAKMMAHCNVTYELEYENIKDSRDFETEKKRLVDYLNKTQQLGETYFDGKESHSFGVLTAQEWSTMFSKHLDHHLTQFGV